MSENTAISEPSHTPQHVKWGKLIVGLIVLAVLAAAVFYFGTQRHTYLIQNVPYFGIYTLQGDTTLVNGGAQASTIIMLEYWSAAEDNASTVLDGFDSDGDGVYSLSGISNFINALGAYQAEIQFLQIDELGNYINDEARTPLIVYVPITEDVPEQLEVPEVAAVIIGVDEKKKVITMHHYLFGNNYEMSFEEFERLQDFEDVDGREPYLVAQPLLLENTLATMEQIPAKAYTERTDVMENTEELFKDYWVAIWATPDEEDVDLAIDYFNKVENGSNFETYFPPYFKMYTWLLLSELYLSEGNVDEALASANRAVGVNLKLNEPSGSWPGRDLISGSGGRASGPYRALGNALLAQENYAEAIAAYQEALVITPNNSRAQIGLAEAESLLEQQ